MKVQFKTVLESGNYRLCRSIVFSLNLVILATLPRTSPAVAEETSRALPGLVLVLVVDQLRRDRLTTSLPGGLGRITLEGRNYSQAQLDHAGTETCPGHQTILSGRQPGKGGIVANSWINKASGESVYCVEDPEFLTLGGGEGRSPANIRVDTLGDWMQMNWPGTRVFSVSNKDRAAITLGGQHASAAYWLEIGHSNGMTTSSYYEQALPEWVESFNQDLASGFDGEIPASWQHLTQGVRQDDYRYEDDELGRVSGHPLWEGKLERRLSQLRVSPYLDDLILKFATRLVIEEDLGTGPVPDLLAVSLSATDFIGHRYGPESSEAVAALQQLDQGIQKFLDMLADRLGANRVLLVLTSDHGVLPIPEWLKSQNRSQCPLKTGRRNVVGLVLRMYWHLHWTFGPWLSMPGQLVKFAGSQLSVNRKFAAAHHIDPDQVIADLETWVETQDVIEQAWTHREILDGKGDLADLYRHSYDAERTGDLILQMKEDCLIAESSGTGHGSPYGYDRDVPLVIMGPGIEAGDVRTPARTIDIAPTLARHLGISVPDDLDGVVLD